MPWQIFSSSWIAEHTTATFTACQSEHPFAQVLTPMLTMLAITLKCLLFNISSFGLQIGLHITSQNLSNLVNLAYANFLIPADKIAEP